jgi:hypothetical protein
VALAYPRHRARAAGEDGLYTKVVRVDQATGEIEVRIVVQPKETRIAFSGDPRGLSVGDYVTVTIHKNVARVGAAEMKCTKVIWVLQ